MATRRTYEELEHRVKFFEKKIFRRNQAVEVLRESEECYRAAVECSIDGVAILKGDNHLYVNKKYSEIFGYDRPEDIVGKPVSMWVHPDDWEQLVNIVRSVQQDMPAPDRYECKGVRKDKDLIYLAVFANKTIYRGESASLVYVRDITDQKEIEERLRQRTFELGERVKELNCLLSISSIVEKPDISLEEILQGTVNLIPSALRYLEIACARVRLNQVGQEFKTSNFKDTILKITCDIMVHGQPYGTLVVCYLEKRPDNHEEGFLKEERALIKAIAERLGRIVEHKQADEALLQSETRFRNLIENLPVGIFIIQNDQIVYQNPEQKKILGRLPRLSTSPYFENLHPDDVEKVKKFFQSLISGEFKTLNLDFIFYPTGKMDSISDTRWAYCRGTCIEYGGENAILVNVMDLTKVKELEYLLRIEDKMSSLGRVAAGMTHEIRNPLSTINVYLNILESFFTHKEFLKTESPCRIKESIDEIGVASKKIETVIKRVMDFSKPGTPKFNVTDINQCIEAAVALSDVTLRKMGIKLETALGKDLPRFYLDSQALEEVMLNLITNAIEAMMGIEGPKKIAITSSGTNPITITVSDSGPGVPQDAVGKVFDPFYTTKDNGSGIGLSICHRIVCDHGGSLKISTSRWGGAEFRIEIPIKGKVKP